MSPSARSCSAPGSATSWEQIHGLFTQALNDAELADAGFPTADDALRSAGIGPGHPSLYPDTEPTESRAADEDDR